MIALRIAHIGLRCIGEDVSGGVETHVGELAPRLAAMGHEVTVFTRRPYCPPGRTMHRGVHRVPRPCIHTKHLEAISHTALGALSSLRGFDLVHFHSVGPSLLSWLPRLGGRTVVATVHALDHLQAKWGPVASAALRLGGRAAVTFPHRTIAVSRFLARRLEELHGAGVEVIPNGVSLPAPAPLDSLTRHGIHESGYIVFLGRLIPDRDVHGLVEAWRLADRPRPLVIVGGQSHTGDYERSLRDMAAQEPDVIFTGPLYGAEKSAVLHGAGLFVLPSRVEGLPIALLEAAAAGSPLLASDIGPCLEALETLDACGGNNAALRAFPVGDRRALARAMTAMLADPGLKAAAKGLPRAVAAGFHWDAIARRTQDVYLAALGRGD